MILHYWLYILEKSLTLCVYFYMYFPMFPNFMVTLYLFTLCSFVDCYLS